MHRFSGSGGSLYATGSPFAFRGTPLEDCGDGFVWKAADHTMLCWTDLHAVEVYEHGLWTCVLPEAVRLDVAEVDLPRCLTGLHVRASGVALPTTLVAEGDGWSLEQAVIAGRHLGGPAVGLGSTVAYVRGAEFDPTVRTVMAVLPSAPAGAFMGFGEAEPFVSGVKVLFDNRGVTYANG